MKHFFDILDFYSFDSCTYIKNYNLYECRICKELFVVAIYFIVVFIYINIRNIIANY